MLLLVLLAGAGSVGAEVLARHRDSAFAVRSALVLVTAGILLIGLALSGVGSLPVLVAGMGVYGLGLGANDAASNMQAVAVEHSVGRPMMPSFHAAWTAGGLVATLGAIALPDLRFGTASVVLALFPLGLAFAPFLRRDHGSEAADPSDLGVPWRLIMLVGLGLVLFYTVDTAVTAWGPVYLSSDQVFTDPPTSPAMYALATLPYLVATLLARSGGRPGHGPLRCTERRAAGLGRRVRRARDRRLRARGRVAGGRGRVLRRRARRGRGRAAGLLGRCPGRRARRPDRPGGAPGPGRCRRGAVQPVQLRRRPARCGAHRVVGTSTLRIGFAVPMVLVLGLLPLARHFATVGAPE